MCSALCTASCTSPFGLGCKVSYLLLLEVPTYWLNIANFIFLLVNYSKLGLIAIEEGTCEENGYDEHIADKAIREYTITIEVELYTQSDEE